MDECFCGVTTRAEDIIYDQKFSGAAADPLNANTIDRNF
ncbi:TPA: DNA-packaging protein [Escherichia coli]|nr:DNA-packaging protein [Escherichia coli]HAJ0795589.1 DNA-packaging protein [Escherichia coli]